MDLAVCFRSLLRRLQSPPTETALTLPEDPSSGGETVFYRTLAWISAGAGALALGLFVGRELRSRYKFSRRTPYDVYAHAGDSQEFGIGI